MIQELYDSIINAVISTHKLSNLDFSSLYRSTEILFHNRQIFIRYVRIPTFRTENRYSFYIPYLVTLHEPFFFSKEIAKIHRQCMEATADARNIDSYTIFLFAKPRDYIDPLTKFPMQRYKTFIINTVYPTRRHAQRVISFITNFLRKRISEMRKRTVYASVLDDLALLETFCEKIERRWCVYVRSVEKI